MLDKKKFLVEQHEIILKPKKIPFSINNIINLFYLIDKNKINITKNEIFEQSNNNNLIFFLNDISIRRSPKQKKSILIFSISQDDYSYIGTTGKGKSLFSVTIYLEFLKTKIINFIKKILDFQKNNNIQGEYVKMIFESEWEHLLKLTHSFLEKNDFYNFDQIIDH